MSWISDTIGAALIAGVASFLGLLITNQSKVSEFRQEWIDALRSEVATLISAVFTIQDVQSRNKSRARSGEIAQELQVNNAGGSNLDQVFTELHKSNALISLRLNMKEKESRAIIDAMAALRTVIYDADAGFEQVAVKVNDLTHATQLVLKNEWRRVKRGEAVYRWTFRAAVLSIFILLIVLFFRNSQWLSHVLMGK